MNQNFGIFSRLKMFFYDKGSNEDNCSRKSKCGESLVPSLCWILRL